MSSFITPRGNVINMTNAIFVDINNSLINYGNGKIERFQSPVNAESYLVYLNSQFGSTLDQNVSNVLTLPSTTTSLTWLFASLPISIHNHSFYVISSVPIFTKGTLGNFYISASGGSAKTGTMYYVTFIDEYTLKCEWANDGDGSVVPTLNGSSNAVILYYVDNANNQSSVANGTYDGVEYVTVP